MTEHPNPELICGAQEIIARSQGLSDCHLRLAGAADVSAVAALNDSAIQHLGREGLFMSMDSQFILSALAHGVVLLLEIGSELQGYSIAVPAGPEFEPFQAVDPLISVGLLFGSAVKPEARRQGWHSRFITMRKQLFAENGYDVLQCTVSPFNLPSLSNLVNNGFAVTGLKTLLDGHPRFILMQDTSEVAQSVADPPHVPDSPTVRSLRLDSHNLGEHEKLLSAGWIAKSINHLDSELCLQYEPGEVSA
ncbi:MAG: hypothetical protein OXD44_05555 [Gammaproteobacteria bacterium]|nr:hypothetical protein [Gammaproteobacteria bacterium]